MNWVLTQYELLDQDAVWINVDEVTVDVTDIDPEYAGNIVRLLERKASAFYWVSFMELLALADLERHLDGGDMASYYAEQELNYTPPESPYDWLHEKPLVRALAARSEVARV